MRCLCLFAIFCAVTLPLQSQTAENIIAGLQAINQTVTEKICSAGDAAAISNRAMNVFLADKTGYLSESSDLSLYTNYVTLNSSQRKFTINHNFQKKPGMDDPISQLLSVGLSANIADGFAASFPDKKFENELGVTVNYKWLGKVKTRFSDCSLIQNSSNQKLAMDALRAALVNSLEIDINKKVADFEAALNGIEKVEVPGQNADTAKVLVQHKFYENLQEEYAGQFAVRQAEVLTQTNNFRLITTGWTSLTAYIPIIYPTYTVAQTYTTAFGEKHPYPFNFSLSHTRLWESSKKGRFFLTLGGNVLFNNSKLSYDLDKTNFTDYKNLGGTDTLHLAGLKNDNVYIGYHETFITPSINVRVVYFLPSSHIGISFLIEQNLGRYDLLNGRLGIPVVLINRKKLPAVNFEFYLSFFDMNGNMTPEQKHGNKTLVGIGMGIPLSRLMF